MLYLVHAGYLLAVLQQAELAVAQHAHNDIFVFSVLNRLYSVATQSTAHELVLKTVLAEFRRFRYFLRAIRSCI